MSRVLACLYEENVEFQLISINMSKGEHKARVPQAPGISSTRMLSNSSGHVQYLQACVLLWVA
ncbi:hypothetical protein ACB098_01G070500 [Castanea mollissima]